MGVAERPKTRAADPGAAVSAAEAGRGSNTLQTLDRGLQALSLIGQSEGGLSIAELASRLDVHRAICYRLANTLEAHGFIARRPDGQFHLGPGIFTLAARFEPQFIATARPLLHRLAEESGATAFVSVPDGDACVAIKVCEPEGGLLRLAYRVGSRHPLHLGAAGIAILSGRPARKIDSEAVQEARRQGYSITRSQLQRGAVGVASPLRRADSSSDMVEASIGLVSFEGLDVQAAARLVRNAAAALALTLAPERE